MRLVVLATAVLCAAGTTTAGKFNPIRRVVGLLQKAADKVVEDGHKDEILHIKFVCYCKSNREKVAREIKEGLAAIESFQAKYEEAVGLREGMKSTIAGKKKDREQANQALEEAAELRKKENATFTQEDMDFKNNISGLKRAIAAIRKGTGQAFLQAHTKVADQISHLLDSANLDDLQMEDMQSFLQGQSSSSVGEIIGILTTMLEQMEKDAKEAVENEESAQATYQELDSTTRAEINAATNIIETSAERQGDAAVAVTQNKNALENENKSLADNQAFQKILEEDCGGAQKDYDTRQEMRAQESQAIADTVQILQGDENDQQAGGAQAVPVFLQTAAMMPSRGEARNVIHAARQLHPHSLPLGFIEMALAGKSVSFDGVLRQIDEMVAQEKKLLEDDHKKKDWCNGELNEAEMALKDSQHSKKTAESQMQDFQEQVNKLTEEAKTLEAGLKDLDVSVKTATAQRKDENAAFKQSVQDNQDTVNVLNLAINRLNKFYNPEQYVPGDAANQAQMMGAVSFLQMRQRPETGSYKKGGGGGVVQLLKDMKRDIKHENAMMEKDEENAQKEYTELLQSSQDKRKADSESVVAKADARAGLEEQVNGAADNLGQFSEEVMNNSKILSDIHAQCDHLLQNFDTIRKTREDEIDAMQNAKSVLKGASE